MKKLSGGEEETVVAVRGVNGAEKRSAGGRGVPPIGQGVKEGLDELGGKIFTIVSATFKSRSHFNKATKADQSDVGLVKAVQQHFRKSMKNCREILMILPMFCLQHKDF